jgi:hypothetical protein
MHKRMLELSARLAALPDANSAPAMQALLHRAQANDAYWHGLFGGLYLPHLRRAIWNNLLASWRRLDWSRLARWPTIRIRATSISTAMSTSVRARRGTRTLVVRDDGNAALVELSSLPLAHNFGDTLHAYAARPTTASSISRRAGARPGRRHRLGARPRRLPPRDPCPSDAEPDSVRAELRR